MQDYSTSANLLSISRKLRQVLAQKDFDYSYAQVLSRLISKALDNHSPAYQCLAHASTVLEDVISPSSGLGLVDMWSQLRIVRPAEITSVDIRSLAGLPMDVSEPGVSGSYEFREVTHTLNLSSIASRSIRNPCCCDSANALEARQD